MIRKKISVILFLVVLISCNSLDKKIIGNWVVDKAYWHAEPALWNLYSNGFTLKGDHTCELPIWDWEDRHSNKQKGTWKVFTQNDSIYLQINTENELFNRTFQVQNLRKERDPESWGYLTKMTLAADSLKMECTGVLYE